MRLHTPAVLLLFVLLSPGRAGGQQLSAADRAQLVAMVWSDARSSAAAWPGPRADWDSALGAALRAAAPPQSDLLFYRRLARLVALLDDGQARWPRCSKARREPRCTSRSAFPAASSAA